MPFDAADFEIPEDLKVERQIWKNVLSKPSGKVYVGERDFPSEEAAAQHIRDIGMRPGLRMRSLQGSVLWEEADSMWQIRFD